MLRNFLDNTRLKFWGMSSPSDLQGSKRILPTLANYTALCVEKGMGGSHTAVSVYLKKERSQAWCKHFKIGVWGEKKHLEPRKWDTGKVWRFFLSSHLQRNILTSPKDHKHHMTPSSPGLAQRHPESFHSIASISCFQLRWLDLLRTSHQLVYLPSFSPECAHPGQRFPGATVIYSNWGLVYMFSPNNSYNRNPQIDLTFKNNRKESTIQVISSQKKN